MTERMISRAFADLTTDTTRAAEALSRFQHQMAQPPRAYHTEKHISEVLTQIYNWSVDAPSVPLIAAALYHDVIYDATRPDNELQSAVFCHEELTRWGIAVIDIVQATNLIQATTYHRPHLQNANEVLLVDADLFILGSIPSVYDTYIQAIRTEYGHVSSEQWRVGRKAVMERFLNRERLYQGNWEGHIEREAQARSNIAREIAMLEHA